MAAKPTLLTQDHCNDIIEILKVVAKNPDLTSHLTVAPEEVINTAPSGGYRIPSSDYVTYQLRKKMREYGINVTGACDNPDGSPRNANAVMTELRLRFDNFMSI